MENYKRKIIEDISRSHPFNVNDMISNLVDRNVLESREISEFQEPMTISALIDILQEKEDDAFGLFVKVLESTRYPEELIATIKEEERIEKERAAKIEAATVNYSFSTNPSRPDPFIFLDIMSQLAESLEEADIRLLCEHFNILRGEREKINKSKRPGTDVVFLLRQRLLITSHDVKELHKVLKNAKSAQILLQYMEILTYPEITLTGTWKNWEAITVQADPHSMFKIFRRLKLFFERKTQTVLFHINKEGHHLTVRIPTLEALNTFVEVTNTKLVAEEVSSQFLHHRQSNDDTFQLKVNEIDLDWVRTILDKKCSFSAVPLCIPNNYIWDSHRKTLSVDERTPKETLQICREGFELLKNIGNEMIVVVCVTGSAKSGKSFFASQLQNGLCFESYHVPNAHTTGIWIDIGATPIRVGEDTARVVILDAQGLGTLTEHFTDATWEYKLSSLCLLLSSYFIFNTKGPPNCEDLHKLGCIADFSRSISDVFQEVKQETFSKESCQFNSPDFLWLLQDNLYKPDLINGEACSWTKYVKVALLTPQKGEIELNGIRMSITSTFNSIRASDLPPPTYDRNAVTDLLADRHKDKINQNFLHRLELESKQILSVSQVKKIRGSKVTGNQFSEILKDFVSAVNCSKLQVTRVWDVVADVHLQRYQQDVLGEYIKQMEKIELPEDDEVFYHLHEERKLVEISRFRKAISRFDNNQLVMTSNKNLDKKIDQCFQLLVRKHEDSSLQFNQQLLFNLEENFLNNLHMSANLSCQMLTDSENKCLSQYDDMAKGPKAGQVKQNTKEDRDLKITNMRKSLLENAESESLKLFKRELEEMPINEENTSKVKGQISRMSLDAYEKVVCNDVSCNLCLNSRLRLSKKLNDNFESWLSRRPKQSSSLLFNSQMLVSLILVLAVAFIIMIIIGTD